MTPEEQALVRYRLERALLHRDFIRPGLIPLPYGQVFDLLFNNRQKGDYSDLVVFQAERTPKKAAGRRRQLRTGNRELLLNRGIRRIRGTNTLVGCGP